MSHLLTSVSGQYLLLTAKGSTKNIGKDSTLVLLKQSTYKAASRAAIYADA
jgi:hypothetical protein